METLKQVSCFVSSPGDCEAERISCEKVIEKINGGLARHLGIIFVTLKWEKDVLPDMANGGQELIDSTINTREYDIFIGIMKNRFGRPTGDFGGGTEHEFMQALERKKASSNNLPQIFFFFGKELIDPDSFDSEQYSLVKQFKSKIGSLGLYIEFSNQHEFELTLTNNLELFIPKISPFEASTASKKIEEADAVQRKLEYDLKNSLRVYNEISPVWIDPILSYKREIPDTPLGNYENQVIISEIVNSPRDIVIKAPAEFGLTTLAHYLKLEAWKTGKIFLYVDGRMTKKHKIIKDIKKEVETYFYRSVDEIDCILLDSISFEETGVMQMVKNICDEFKSTPIIIFNTTDDKYFLLNDDDDSVEIGRVFSSMYLLPLPQNEVRKIVSSYQKCRSIEDDCDVIISKINRDLETLNLHRTAKNCISILRASSRIGAEYNPVNRTKLLEIILSTIFEEYETPTYHDKKPDIKDCSFVLGYFCEWLVVNSDFEFTEEMFKLKIKQFSDSNLLYIDVNYLFNPNHAIA